MKFLNDEREVQMHFRDVKVKAGKDDARVVKIRFSVKISDELEENLPRWMRKGVSAAYDVAGKTTSVAWDQTIESQSIGFHMLPTESKRVTKAEFKLEAVDLSGFEVEREDEGLVLLFETSAPLTKPLWDFLFYAAYRGVWAEITECQQELPEKPRDGKSAAAGRE
jgi:hypothetical protein